MTLLERLSERWERMDGAAATKIDRILKERRDAAAEIRNLRTAMTGIQGLLFHTAASEGGEAREAFQIAASFNDKDN